MIRPVAVVSLVTLLILVLYLPSRIPAERFVEQLKREHELNQELWGESHATAILSRMLDFQEVAEESSPVPRSDQAPRLNAVNAAVAEQFNSVNQRVFHNFYFRSIDALVALAMYRLSVCFEWLRALVPFIAAALIDGSLVRAIRAKEFKLHSPGMYATYICATIVTTCGIAVMLAVPVTVPRLLLPCLFTAIGIFLSRAIANFHQRN